MRLPQLRIRIVTGAYILHSGIDTWSGSAEQAQGVHGMASGAYPFLQKVKSTDFLRAVSVGEIAVGTALLVPVPLAFADAALTVQRIVMARQLLAGAQSQR